MKPKKKKKTKKKGQENQRAEFLALCCVETYPDGELKGGHALGGGAAALVVLLFVFADNVTLDNQRRMLRVLDEASQHRHVAGEHVA